MWVCNLIALNDDDGNMERSMLQIQQRIQKAMPALVALSNLSWWSLWFLLVTMLWNVVFYHLFLLPIKKLKIDQRQGQIFVIHCWNSTSTHSEKISNPLLPTLASNYWGRRTTKVYFSKQIREYGHAYSLSISRKILTCSFQTSFLGMSFIHLI